MKLRIALFILCVGSIAAFGLFTQAKAENVIVNNYLVETEPRWCTGLMCLLAPAIWAEQDRQAREAQGPHPCQVWNGRAWVSATCAP